jgi:NitT/TauT family transport system permease protein
MKDTDQSNGIKPLDRWLPVVVTVLFLGIWEWLARAELISGIFFPPPTKIVSVLWELIISGKLIPNALISLSRILLGMVFGMLPGLFLGLAMGWSPRIRTISDPFIAAIHPIPKIAIFPLILIIFGIGEVSKIVAVSIGAFFPMLINSMAGVIDLPPVYFDVAENYGANRWKTFTRVILPGSLPMVLAGARIALNMALVITVAVELLISKEGLGVMIWYAWETLRVSELYATLIVIAILGIAINFILGRLSWSLIPWYTSKSNH